MSFLKNPLWIDKGLLPFHTPDDIPEAVFEEINRRLAHLISQNPLVSIVIPAKNEEINIVRTIYSLSNNITGYPFEVIVVNNSSTDRTQDVLDRLQVKSFYQPIAGCGPARQLGQENALGKYILMADADCFYPMAWIETMVTALKQDGVSCVYGRYSFVGTQGKPRWKFLAYEFLRDIVANLRHINSPYLNSLGMSMGYVKEHGLQLGFVRHNIRGEDGRLCFQLMQFGKVYQVKQNAARVWTMPRRLDQEDNLTLSVLARAAVEFSRMKDYFKKQSPHDINTSKTFDPPALAYFKKYKDAHKKNEQK